MGLFVGEDGGVGGAGEGVREGWVGWGGSVVCDCCGGLGGRVGWVRLGGGAVLGWVVMFGDE